jgi:hypothetical protein
MTEQTKQKIGLSIALILVLGFLYLLNMIFINMG